jgi:chromatin segregation and condensation protein Rec8/ScpA/Scc1 (kleisin family)
MPASTVALTPLCLQLGSAVQNESRMLLSEAAQEACQLTHIAGLKIDRLRAIDEIIQEENPLDWLEGIEQFAQMKELSQKLFKRQQSTLGWLPRGLTYLPPSVSIRLASMEDLKRHFEKAREKELSQATLTHTLKPEEGPSLEEIIQETWSALNQQERLEMDSWLSQACVRTCISRFLALLELFKQEKILLYICDIEDELWIYPQTNAKVP